MFTGLVEETGRIRSVAHTDAGASVTVAASFASELSQGESVALDGICLSVTSSTAECFTVDVVPQTLNLTTLGTLRSGTEVNLERALRLGDRLGGHMVTGHADGTGTIVSMTRSGESVELVIELVPDFMKYIVLRGSITIDGASLTVSGTSERTVTIALIPETLRNTIAGNYKTGRMVNIETDVLARHIEGLLETHVNFGGRQKTDRRDGLTMKRLRELGLVE